jgi:hypothetical protein
LRARFFRYSLHASIQQPLIGLLASGGSALYGNSPAAHRVNVDTKTQDFAAIGR